MRGADATGCVIKMDGYRTTTLKLVSGVASVGLLRGEFLASGSLVDSERRDGMPQRVWTYGLIGFRLLVTRGRKNLSCLLRLDRAAQNTKGRRKVKDINTARHRGESQRCRL